MTTLPDITADTRWLLWRLEDGKKLPYYADGTRRRGSLDSLEDRSKLVPFDEAQRATRARDKGFHVALAVSVPLVFIDLDRCLSDSGEWCGTDEQRAIRDAAQKVGAVIARSQSRHGLHIFGLCHERFTRTTGRIEIYTGGRFCAWTGDIESMGDTLPDLTEIVRQYAKPKADPLPAKVNGHGTIPEGGRNAALTKYAGQLRRIGASPDELEAALLERNLAQCQPPLPPAEVASIAQSVSRYEPASGDDEHTAPPWPAPLDLVRLAGIPPAPPEMIIPDWLPAGYGTLLAGHGGMGKSGIALHLALCIATGREFYGLPVQRRKVLYMSCEDRESVIHWRLARLCEYRDVHMPTLAGSLAVLDLVGHDTLLWLRAGAPPPDAYEFLRERMQGYDVLIVDGISDTFAGNENARAEAKAFINSLVALIPPSGAVVLVGHVAKTSTTSGEGYSGSTGWHNSVRARWYLAPETIENDGAQEQTGSLILELQKSNLGGGQGQRIRLAWDSYAHVFVGELVGTRTRRDREQADQTERAAILEALRACVASGDYCPAATTGPRTAWHVLSARKGVPDTLRDRAGKRRFWRHIEALRSMREIREGSIRRKDRKSTATLEPVGPGNAEPAANAPMLDSDIHRAVAQAAPAANAPMAQGGYRGGAHAHPCPKCAGEGCLYCRPLTINGIEARV